VRWSKKTTLLVPGCLFVLLCLAGMASASEIMVSAALSLKSPFEEIKKVFEKKSPGTKAVFNFAASGVLQKQIEGGAPSDVFASASPKEMDLLEKGGFLIRGTRSDFAGNAVALIVPEQTRLQLKTLEDLRKKEVRRIAIGNPATVPAGKYAEEVLKNLGLWEAVKDRLVLCEHVRQVMDYVARNEVDAGLLFLTDAGNSRGVKVISTAPEQSHKPIVYVIAAIKGPKNETAARDFISLVMSKEGREVFRRHGFKTAN